MERKIGLGTIFWIFAFAVTFIPERLLAYWLFTYERKHIRKSDIPDVDKIALEIFLRLKYRI